MGFRLIPIFVGNTFVITAAGEFFYSGPAGPGKLIGSEGLTAAGTDGHGNATLPGTVSYYPTTGLAIQMYQGVQFFYSGPVGGAGPWTSYASFLGSPWTVGNASASLANNGNLTFQSGADANIYATGRLTAYAPGSQTIATSPGYTALTGLTVPVVAGTYHFRAHLWYTDNGVGVASNALFKVQGPAFSHGSYSGTFTANGPLVSERFDNTSGFNVALVGPTVTPGSGTFFSGVIEGLCTFTGNGNLLLQAACGAAGGARFVIADRSFLELFPA